MNRAPSGPGNPGLGPNAENLDGVLARFQDWAKTRQSQPSSKYGPTAGIGRSTASRKASLGGGVRELSYEQALRASSYGRKTHPEPGEMPPQGLKARAAATPQVASPELVSPRNPRQSTAGGTKSAPSPKTIASAGSTTVTSAQARTQTTGMGGAVANISRIRRTTPRSPVLPPEKRQPVQPSFGQVLKGTAGLSATSTAVLRTKSVALSLRVSDTEQARILACAARANLSVSAYLRQCALGVDELRDQVELALAQLHKQDLKSPPPGLSAIPGIFGSFIARLFRRLRGNHDYTAISLH